MVKRTYALHNIGLVSVTFHKCATLDDALSAPPTPIRLRSSRYRAG